MEQTFICVAYETYLGVMLCWLSH